MKTKSFIIAVTTVLLMIACKDENQAIIDKISGTWKIEEITYSQTGQAIPDSVIKYSTSTFQFDNCALTGSTRQCTGYYNTNGNEKVNIQYGVSASNDETSISVMETKIPKINLHGSYKVTVNGNSMTMSGPQSSNPNYQGKTILIKLNK